MLNPRLLVILSALPNADTMLDMVLSALSHAKRPYNIHFAVPAHFADIVAISDLPHGVLRHGDLKYYEEAAGISSVLPLITDETHFLSLQGVYSFADGWEGVLFSRFSKIPKQYAVLTALVTGEDDAAQACLPAIDNAGESGARFIPGLPLVCSKSPVKTLLIFPHLVMGRLDFLRQVDTSFATLSIAAYAAGYQAYALDRAPLWPSGRSKRAVSLLPPGPHIIPPPSLARFEQLAGFSFGQGTVSVRTQNGIFGVEDVYAQELPLRLAVSEAANAVLKKSPQTAPLVVSAFIDLPDSLTEPQAYMLRFSFLRGLRSLPLTLYTGGAWERQLRSKYPNTLAYPDNTLLPRTLLGEGMTSTQLFKRNKWLLLKRTVRAYPTFSHFAWLDMSILPHPVCTQAQLDFEPLMDERIHLGWVDGQPDTSFLLVPRHCLTLIVREVQSITHMDSVMKRSFSEGHMIRLLMDKFPDLFILHPLPKKGLLFMTVLDQSLLSATLCSQLANLSTPIKVPPGTVTQKGSLPDE